MPALEASEHPAFDYAVVDEAQDLGVGHLRFLAALGGERPEALFFAGDVGQRIFQPAFSWKALGIDVRGRARTLRVNYRTSHQIRQVADRLLGTEAADADGNSERRDGTVSVFNGAARTSRVLDSARRKSGDAIIVSWLESLARNGVRAAGLEVFVRSAAQLPRALLPPSRQRD